MIGGQCRVHGGFLRGVEAIPVDIEVAITEGIPGFSVVGMADAAVLESRERVKHALRRSGFRMPKDKVVVNLAPSSLRKGGSGFDLPIAVGILVASGQVNPGVLDKFLFVGELSLDGGVRPVAGLLAYALCARSLSLALMCSAHASGVVRIAELEQWGMRSLADLRTGELHDVVSSSKDKPAPMSDFVEIAGNEVGKRALQIAAAGNHGVLMMGPPGSGKTMLASCLPSILPPLDEEERLQAALVHSVAGEDASGVLQGVRPFRKPHHSASSAGLIGGGSPVRPGEISLAHTGVLMLDELPEFKPSVLQQLRQPLESGMVCITRADGNVTFPARFMLVAAANPCPCGFFGDPERPCTCTVPQINNYQNRIGGPLMDRIDIHVDVRRVPPEEVIESRRGSSSEDLAKGVLAAREYASWRLSQGDGRSTTKEVIASCRLEASDERFFERIARSHNMSGRGIVRTLSVARTIADMAQRKRVNKNDLCEAISFRVREGSAA